MPEALIIDKPTRPAFCHVQVSFRLRFSFRQRELPELRPSPPDTEHRNNFTSTRSLHTSPLPPISLLQPAHRPSSYAPLPLHLPNTVTAIMNLPPPTFDLDAWVANYEGLLASICPH